MRETSTSLRWFFGIFSFLYLCSVAVLFLTLAAGVTITVSNPVTLLAPVLGFIDFLVFLYFAVTLPSFLNPERVKWVEWALLGSLILWVLNAVVTFAIGGGIDYVSVIFAILITWYLYHQIDRLAHPAPADMAVQPPKKRSVGMWILIVIVVLVVLAIIGILITGSQAQQYQSSVNAAEAQVQANTEKTQQDMQMLQEEEAAQQQASSSQPAVQP